MKRKSRDDEHRRYVVYVAGRGIAFNNIHITDSLLSAFAPLRAFVCADDDDDDRMIIMTSRILRLGRQTYTMMRRMFALCMCTCMMMRRIWCLGENMHYDDHDVVTVRKTCTFVARILCTKTLW